MPVIHRRLIERIPVTDAVITGNPALDRCLANRQICTSQEMATSLCDIPKPAQMRDAEKAADRIMYAIKHDERILILGDYDADGATATVIMREGLRSMGAQHVEFAVPDRIRHGYGLSPAIAGSLEARSPDLIITVDNGTSSLAGADMLKKWQKPPTLIVTDHHLPSALGSPDAFAIVNPNRTECDFPSRNLAGCGVAWYTIAALRQIMRQKGHFRQRPEPDIRELLDLVALGTIADVVPMDRLNRALVSAGMAQIQKREARPGILALAASAQARMKTLTSQDVAFTLAPRINAAGRMSSMALGIECLSAPDFQSAIRFAEKLDAENLHRRDITRKLADEGMEDWDTGKNTDTGIVATRKDAHPGVIGLAASRFVERSGKPAICFAEHDKDLLKGSARSVEGVHLKHILDAINAEHPHWLAGFGGHAMAAGLTLKRRYTDDFREAFSDKVRALAPAGALDGARYIDALHPPAEWHTLKTAQALESAAHWGAGFEAPAFAGDFRVLESHPLREGHKRLLLQLKGDTQNPGIEGIVFRCPDPDWGQANSTIQCRYTMQVKRYRGPASLQILILDPLESLEVRPDISWNGKQDSKRDRKRSQKQPSSQVASSTHSVNPS